MRLCLQLEHASGQRAGGWPVEDYSGRFSFQTSARLHKLFLNIFARLCVCGCVCVCVCVCFSEPEPTLHCEFGG